LSKKTFVVGVCNEENRKEKDVVPTNDPRLSLTVLCCSAAVVPIPLTTTPMVVLNSGTTVV
jgi:hypothetical protein